MTLKRPFIILVLALLPIAGGSTAALAESALTYSSTQQSQLVRTAIDALNRNDLPGFRKLLTDRALETYGTPEAMQVLRSQYQRQAAQSSSIETQSDRVGMWRGDTLVLLSSRVHAVNVLGRRNSGGDALDPIWNVSVKCYTFSLTDSFGGPAFQCRISDLSVALHAQESSAPSQAPSIRASAGKPVLDSVSGSGATGETPVGAKRRTAGLGVLE